MRLRIPQHDRERLKQLARGTKDVRLLRRAQALLDLDAGDQPRGRGATVPGYTLDDI